MWRARLAASTVALASLTACVGDDTTADVTAAPTSTIESTTSITTPSTAPPTTTPTTDTTPPPSTPTTIPLDDQIRAAYDEIYWGYWGCLRSPLDCDTSWLLDGSGSAIAMEETMQGLADRGRFVGDDDVGYYVIEDVVVEPSATVATVVACWWSTAVLYTGPADPSRPAGPDNPPTIVNDTPGSARMTDTLSLFDGAWRLGGSSTSNQVAEENQCSDAA
jgi:hypothetical protein